VPRSEKIVKPRTDIVLRVARQVAICPGSSLALRERELLFVEHTDGFIALTEAWQAVSSSLRPVADTLQTRSAGSVAFAIHLPQRTLRLTLDFRFAAGALAVLLTAGGALARDRVQPDIPLPAGAPQGSAVAAPTPPALAANPGHEAPAPTIKDLVAKHAHDNGVPVDLANAVIRIESRFNPAARNRGAFGLMQINAGTARTLGFSGNASGLLSPDTNLLYGMKVLAGAYRASGGDLCRTLAFYQSGHPVRRLSHAQRGYCSKARSFMAHA
jgi:soluble lytic murein transglycosylase-like protein